MKIKAFTIITLLLCILTISAVCAEENTTELADSIDEAVISQTEDPDIYFSVNKELVKDEPLTVFYSTSDYPKITGNLSFYIDDEFSKNESVSGHASNHYYLDMKNYQVGSHICRIDYSGNDLFKSSSQSFKFEIVDVSFICKDTVYDNGAISVKVPGDAIGYVTIKVNESTESFDLRYIVKDYYSTKTVTYSLDDLKYGNYAVEMTYSGNYGYITKKAKVKKDFYFDFHLNEYSLTDYINTHSVLFFGGVTGNVSVLIDGKDINYDITDYYPAERYSSSDNYYDGCLFDCAPIWLDRLSLSKGNHTIEVRFGGDNAHPAKSIKDTFYLNHAQLAYLENPLINSIYPIDLIFSENTTGNVSFYSSPDGENYTLLDCTDIVNNTAKINILCNRTGNKYIKATYNTSNGNDTAYTSFNVVPAAVKFYRWIGVDPYHSETFTLESGNGVTGNFSIYVNDKLFKRVKITDRITKITVTNPFTKAGEYVITARWDTNYGSGSESTRTIEVYEGNYIIFTDWSHDNIVIYYGETTSANLKKYATVFIGTYEHYSISNSNKVVTYKIGKQTFKVKTDKNGFATLKVPNTVKPGKIHNIRNL